MAVDFSANATTVGTEMTPAVRQQEPVSRGGEISALQNIGDGLKAGAQTAATYFQNKDNLNSNKRFAGFMGELLTIQEGEDQGNWNSGETIIRARQRLQQTIQRDPSNAEEYLKGFAKWRTMGGYGSIATPSQSEYAREQKAIQDATDSGFLALGEEKSPKKVEEALSKQQEYRAAITSLELNSKKLSEQSSRLDLTSKQRSELKEQAKTTANVGLANIGAKAVPFWQAQSKTWVNKITNAKSEAEKVELIKQGSFELKQMLAQNKAAVLSTLGDGDNDQINQLFKMQEEYVDTIISGFDGSVDGKTLETMQKNMSARINIAALETVQKNPRTAKFVGLSNIVRDFGSILQGSDVQSDIVVDLLSQIDDNQKNGARPPDMLKDGDGEKEVRGTLDTVKNVIRAAQLKGDLTPEAKDDITVQINGVLASISKYGKASDKAGEFQPVIDFFADPNVGKWIKEGGKLNPAAKAGAMDAIQNGYATEVVPLLREEFDRIRTQRSRSEGSLNPDLIEPSIDSGKFAFKGKGTLDVGQKRLLDNLNSSSFVKVMNKMIMSQAHINGDTDYKKAFDEISPEIFGGGDGGKVSGDLSLEDVGGEDDAIQPASFVAADSNPDIDAEVLEKFKGKKLPVSIRNNNMGAISITGDVASSWAAKQPGFVGTSKRPKNEGGYYAAYATPEDGVAAASRLLENYGDDGVNTASKIVRKWSADKTAHNTYAQTVIKYLNDAGYDVDVKDELDLSDPMVRMAILKAKSAHESGAGKPVYSDKVFTKGVNYGSDVASL